MKISLLTDAPKHNLALMKISAWHKENGDDILLNAPLFHSDYTYASVLYEHNYNKISEFNANEYGGPAIKNSKLNDDFEKMKPDYSLYDLKYSLGYTFRPCFNDCSFCAVPKMDHPDVQHHSIFEFHDTNFDTISLLNNNTFQDPNWKETFKEIWDADLKVIDQNGYDLRLLDDEKAQSLKKTKFVTEKFLPGGVHFAWDRMQDESLIINGLKLLNKYKMRSNSNMVYILIGFDTCHKEDLHRCQIVNDYGLTPYPMPFVKNEYTRKFKRFINLHYYRKYKTIEKAWLDYV